MEIVQIYTELASTAVSSVKIDEKLVKIVYNSNTDKEYTFNCDNTDEFNTKLSNTLTNKESVGRFISSSVKEGLIVPSK
ncbi:MAG: hypothetical protein CMO44_16605 [Verrucomicrobiales bacterium]|nr:hypothetical protein [Verrucomicrobiales bacterium]|tara:strand:+ start:1455 stop:1691 length:237 start_codon:yes stop_codon:yes gene_type:complete